MTLKDHLSLVGVWRGRNHNGSEDKKQFVAMLAHASLFHGRQSDSWEGCDGGGGGVGTRRCCAGCLGAPLMNSVVYVTLAPSFAP